MAAVTAFPAVRIETDRLVVREYEPADAAAVTVVLAAREWEALPHGAPRDPTGVWPWLRDGVHRFRHDGYGAHLAIAAAGGGYVGAMSLFNTDWVDGRVEVGYGIRAALRGRGYVTEALVALTGWVLSRGGMRRVDLLTAPDNLASQRVAHKAGYTRDGTVADPVSGRQLLRFTHSRGSAAGDR